MSLEIQRREREGIVLLDLKGRLVAGPGVAAFREAIDGLKDEGKMNLVLNLLDAEYVDSTGLGALVLAHTTLKKAGGVIKLLHANQRNIELLVMTKLSTVFEIFNDEQDAVNSFFPDRKITKFDILDFVRKMKAD